MVATEPNDSSGEFFFVEPKREKKRRKKSGFPFEIKEIQYKKEEEDGDWRERNIKNQIEGTLNQLDTRPLRFGDEIFYILDLKYKPSDSQFRKVLNRLNAYIIVYLNETHNRILVSASDNTLRQLLENELPKYVESSINLLMPLRPYVQVDNDTSPSERKNFFVRIMPNLKKDRQATYIKKLQNYVKERNYVIHELEDKDLGIVAAEMDYATAQSLANDSTFIFSIYSPPKAKSQLVTKKGKKSDHQVRKNPARAVPTSLENKSPNASFPIVVVMDSGTNDIPQLRGLVSRYAFTGFMDPSDGKDDPDGHGTPISYLVAFGELDTLSAKVISYKIYSDKFRYKAYEGMISGINRFSGTTRLFLTSIGWDSFDYGLLEDLNKLVQKKNIILVSSAGNICYDEIEKSIQNGLKYPSYLKGFPVMAPGLGTSIISVGSIVKSNSNNSLARPNLAAPYSRCGFDKKLPLYDCKKPEVVEHGCNVDLVSGKAVAHSLGVRSINKKGALVNSLIGTSFSSPLYIHKIAQIENLYGKIIRNSETLKAISIITCNNSQYCTGFGEPKEFTECDRNHALYCTEGEIQLSDKTESKTITVYSDQIQKIRVPDGIGKIDLCLVHSDNFQKSAIPSLNTYLELEARKTGRQSAVVPTDKRVISARTNIKLLTYRFKSRSMGGTWRFTIIPETTTRLHPEDRKNISVRYGCAILLTRRSSRPSLYSVNQEIKMM